MNDYDSEVLDKMSDGDDEQNGLPDIMPPPLAKQPLTNVHQAFTDSQGSYHPQLTVDTLGDAQGNPFERVADNSAPMENIEDKLVKQAGAQGFQSPFEYQRALVQGLRQVAQERGHDLESPEGKQWYAQNLMQGQKEMGRFMAMPSDPKSIIKLDDGSLYDLTKKAVIYQAPSVLDHQQNADDANAIHESLSDQLQRTHELAQQGIKAPPLMLGAPDTAQDNIQPPPQPLPVSAPVQKAPDTSKLEQLANDPNVMAQLRGSKNPRDKGIVAQIDKMTAQKAKEAGESEKQSQALDKQFNDLAKKTPEEATGRSALGMAVTNNVGAKKALTILQQPNMTPQELNMVTGELAKLVAGGVAGEQELKKQGYDTFLGEIRSIQQKLTGTPQDVTNPEIRQRLMKVIDGMMNVNNGVISTHMKGVEILHKDAIAKHQDEWNDYKKLHGVNVDGGQTPTITSKAERDALPNGSSYIYKGQKHIKS